MPAAIRVRRPVDCTPTPYRYLLMFRSQRAADHIQSLEILANQNRLLRHNTQRLDVIAPIVASSPAHQEHPQAKTAGLGISYPNPVNHRIYAPRQVLKHSPTEFRQKIKFSALFRSWFMRSAWEVCVRQSYAGWTFNIRTSNLLPETAPIFKLAEKGDLVRIRKLIDRKFASPFDTTVQYGDTRGLLWVGDSK